MLLQLQLDIESISLCGRVRVPTDGIVHDPRERLIWGPLWNSRTDGTVRMRKDIFCKNKTRSVDVPGYFYRRIQYERK